MREEIRVGGIWLRRIGDRIQVLAEVDGRWSLVIDEGDGAGLSHIVETEGIRKAPLDPVTETGEAGADRTLYIRYLDHP